MYARRLHTYMPACLYAKCDPTYYAPTTHQLRMTYASYTRSTHTFKQQYAYFDTCNTIFLRYEMLSSPTVHTYVRTVGDIKNLTFRNRNTLRITHCFYVLFMITLRKLPCNYARSTRVLRRQQFKTIRTYSYVHA